MEHRILGKTGLKVSILGFGGIPIKDIGEKEAIAVVNRALDLGINLIHTSVTYGDSARKIGEVMKERRNECFIAVKVGGRTEKEAAERLKESLKALNTDHVEIAELPVNAEVFPQVMSAGGAYDAFKKAKEEGLIDFIGITSHDPKFLAEAVKTKAFSNLITPFNYVANAAAEGLLSSAANLDMGVIAMKTLGRGSLPDTGQALRYVWSHDLDTAIVGMKKISEVKQNVVAAEGFQPMTEEEKNQLRKMAEEIIRTGRLSSSGAVNPA